MINLLALLVATNAYAIDLDKNPIYAQIKRNKPRIDSKYAFKLSNSIHKYSSKYRIPANIYTAILMQESGYVADKVNCIKGLASDGLVKRVCLDYSIAQINYRNFERFGFDQELLLTDLDYAVKCGAIVLSDVQKRYSNKDVNWWTRYHSPTPTLRKIYKQLVERYL